MVGVTVLALVMTFLYSINWVMGPDPSYSLSGAARFVLNPIYGRLHPIPCQSGFYGCLGQGLNEMVMDGETLFFLVAGWIGLYLFIRRGKTNKSAHLAAWWAGIVIYALVLGFFYFS